MKPEKSILIYIKDGHPVLDDGEISVTLPLNRYARKNFDEAVRGLVFIQRHFRSLSYWQAEAELRHWRGSFCDEEELKRIKLRAEIRARQRALLARRKTELRKKAVSE